MRRGSPASSGASRPRPASCRASGTRTSTSSGPNEDLVLKLSGPAERPETWSCRTRPSIGSRAARRDCRCRASDPPPPARRRCRCPARTARGPWSRMLTYLPGRILAQARPQSSGVFRDVGRFLGELDRALEGFAHPAAIDRDLDWNPDARPRRDRALPRRDPGSGGSRADRALSAPSRDGGSEGGLPAAQRDPQRRERLERARGRSDPRGAGGHRPDRLRRHAGVLDRLRGGRRGGLRDARARPTRSRPRRRSSPVTTRSTPCPRRSCPSSFRSRRSACA